MIKVKTETAKKDCTGYSISCQNCNLSELCLPFSLQENELQQLDILIERKKPYQKNQMLIEQGERLQKLYAVRSGSFKTYIVDNEGVEQITGFHLPGDVIGFDGLATKHHKSYCQALETSMVCEIPFTTIDDLSETMPALRHQINRLMSNEIFSDQSMFMLLTKKTAEQRICSFLLSLSERFKQRQLSAFSFKLNMTRNDIGNYLGLTVETVSRVFSKLKNAGIVELDGKYITIIDLEYLKQA